MIRLRRLVARRFKQLDQLDLTLPERARILVKGLNEAGKSTLFEAVFFGLFGQGLGGSGARNLDELIRYGADDAQVDLWVGLSDGRSLEIRRQLRRGKPNLWELDLLAAGGEVEETIRGNREVNQRIAAELGFDAEALLNTCFVEQKKLDKLEGMNRAEREQSLMRLLNLDRLLDLVEQLKVRLADRQELARLKDRRLLAACQAQLPAAAAELESLGRSLAVREAHEALAAQQARAQALDGLGQALAGARAEEANLAEQAHRAQALAEARGALAEARQAAEQAADQAAQGGRSRAAAARARQAEVEEIPAVTARGLGLRRLARRRRLLAAWKAEASRLEEALVRRDQALQALAANLAALNAARQEWVAARAEARDSQGAIAALEQDRRAFEVRQALVAWLEAEEGLRGAGSEAPDAVLEQLRTEAAALARRQTRLRGGGLAAAGLLLGLGLVLGPLRGWSIALWPLGLGLLVLLGLGLAWAAAQGRRTALALEQGRLEGEAAERQRGLQQRQAALAAAEARLATAQAIRPATAERGRQALVEIDARLGDRPREAVEAALAEAARRQARAQEAAERLATREAELKAAVEGQDGAALGRERDSWQASQGRLRAALARREPRIAEQAAALGLSSNGATGLGDGAVGSGRGSAGPEQGIEGPGLEEELGVLRARLAELRRLAAEAAPLAAEATALEARAAELGATAASSWARANQAGPPPPAGDATWTEAAAALDAAYAAAGGDALRQRLAAAARESATVAGRLQAEERAFLEAWSRLGALLGAAKLPPPPELRLEAAVGGGEVGAGGEGGGRREGVESVGREGIGREGTGPVEGGGQDADAARLAPAALTAALAAVAAGLPAPEGRDRAALEAALAAARGRLEVLRHDRARLEAELGLAGQALDLAEAEERLAAAEDGLALRDRAARMVEQAGRRVMQGILPGTLLHMQRILPVLTEQRYLEARLTEDLQIEVYDERAANWRKKPIFSGGAKDQFSLALRLAFAMATLPEERGAAPGFLFLDEPLGAFDSRRAEALIDLLCQGEVAGAFDQIFLISHIPVDEARFDRTVALEAGRVVEGQGDGEGGD